MVASCDISQEIFSIDMLRALESSLKHRRKHVLCPLQLYGDQALLRVWSCLRSPALSQVYVTHVLASQTAVVKVEMSSTFPTVPVKLSNSQV